MPDFPYQTETQQVRLESFKFGYANDENLVII